ncbi:hypothetical protein ENKO_216 [Klebsiella phage fENko-Kae01]|nr:hypothetical protein [Klebsiella phage fENko-Kae01]
MVNGFGIYDGDYVGKNTTNKIYQVWRSMIKRCYSKNVTESYKNTTIHDEWKYYSSFEKWYNNNYKENYSLDKDIIGGELNQYSSRTCAFVPREVNNCILDSNTIGSKYPIGVSYHKKEKI